jgi:hypothetical protein
LRRRADPGRAVVERDSAKAAMDHRMKRDGKPPAMRNRRAGMSPHQCDRRAQFLDAAAGLNYEYRKAPCSSADELPVRKPSAEKMARLRKAQEVRGLVSVANRRLGAPDVAEIMGMRDLALPNAVTGTQVLLAAMGP